MGVALLRSLTEWVLEPPKGMVEKMPGIHTVIKHCFLRGILAVTLMMRVIA